PVRPHLLTVLIHIKNVHAPSSRQRARRQRQLVGRGADWMQDDAHAAVVVAQKQKDRLAAAFQLCEMNPTVKPPHSPPIPSPPAEKASACRRLLRRQLMDLSVSAGLRPQPLWRAQAVAPPIPTRAPDRRAGKFDTPPSKQREACRRYSAALFCPSPIV